MDKTTTFNSLDLPILASIHAVADCVLLFRKYDFLHFSTFLSSASANSFNEEQ